jgi:hypothetical protein
VDIALSIFRYQAKNNFLYAQYLETLKIDVPAINALNDIPFLPICFFKSHLIMTGVWKPEDTFQSSGTTLASPSRHLVRDSAFYLEHSRKCFEQFNGPVTDYHFLALLPSYLERKGSSLISMIQYFITASESKESGFYLNQHDELLRKIDELKNTGRKILLWGVSFALLDFAEKVSADLSHCYLFETGGMKGRRKEITRNELHAILKARFNSPSVFSEYGMTELFSQAYTTGEEYFQCPTAMKVIGRDLSDPFCKGLTGETCGLNVIDFANWATISFIETEDMGKVRDDGSFEVIGRLDNSEIRGCSQLV